MDNKIFITLGSQKFQFNRLLKAIDELCEKGTVDAEDVFAQIGYSDYIPKNFSYKKFLDRDEFSKEMGKADIVITHGGTGAIIGAVKKGKKVIAVPRLAKYGEHVDDHQLQLIKQFDDLNLIYSCQDTSKLDVALKTVQLTKYNSYESNTINIILVIPFAFVISGVVDTNTIALTLSERYSVPTLVTGIVLAVVVGIIVFGGIGRIGHVCEVVAPFMGGAYILAGLLIIIVHITEVPNAIAEILFAAFNPRAATGGIVGSIFVCMRYGIARGIYSNEAGLGTAAMVHCGAKVNDPIEQAVWGPVEVFLDTVFICSVTGIAIVLSGLWNSGLDGAVLTMRAFDQLLPGGIGGFICLVSVVLFGFSLYFFFSSNYRI